MHKGRVAILNDKRGMYAVELSDGSYSVFELLDMNEIQAGHLQIDNNPVENSIRSIAVGRKNYLFAGSHEGAKWAAVIYSLMGSCKKNNIEPLSWLTNILTVVPRYPANRLHELLPNYKKEEN